jgi:hypothetical protein
MQAPLIAIARSPLPEALLPRGPRLGCPAIGCCYSTSRVFAPAPDLTPLPVNSQQESDEMLVPHQELPAAEADTAQPMEGIYIVCPRPP